MLHAKITCGSGRTAEVCPVPQWKLLGLREGEWMQGKVGMTVAWANNDSEKGEEEERKLN